MWCKKLNKEVYDTEEEMLFWEDDESSGLLVNCESCSEKDDCKSKLQESLSSDKSLIEREKRLMEMPKNGVRVFAERCFHDSYHGNNKNFPFWADNRDMYYLLKSYDIEKAIMYIEGLMWQGLGSMSTCEVFEKDSILNDCLLNEWHRMRPKSAKNRKKKRKSDTDNEIKEEEKKNGFFFYRGFYEEYRDKLSKEQMEKYLLGLIQVGLYGDTEVDDEIITPLLFDRLRSIEATNKRYKRNVSNGEKGGRSSTVTRDIVVDAIKNHSCSNTKEVAQFLNVSERTIRRHMSAKEIKEIYSDSECKEKIVPEEIILNKGEHVEYVYEYVVNKKKGNIRAYTISDLRWQERRLSPMVESVPFRTIETTTGNTIRK